MRNRPDLPAHHPLNMPVCEWPTGWLILECASLLSNPAYIGMDPLEKQEQGLPVGREDMICFIESRQHALYKDRPSQPVDKPTEI